MNFGARDYREDLDVLQLILEDKRKNKAKQLKLQIASQCLAGILSNKSGYYTGVPYEELAKFAWEAATELMKLSEQEEEEEK